MKRTAKLTLVTMLFLAGAFESTAMARGAGMIFGIDLGGALVSGETNVTIKDNPAGCPQVWGGRDLCQDLFRSDAGSGFAFALRLGYNFFGYASLETYAMGHFNTDSGGGNKFEGAGHWGFLSRYFFLEHVKTLAHRRYDPYVYFGGGPIGYMGFHENFGDKEMRGWKGGHILFGLGGEFYVNSHVSFGVDFRFYKPIYKTYIYDWDENEIYHPVSPPSTLVFMPMATVTFHFMSPDDLRSPARDGYPAPSTVPVQEWH